MNQLKVKEQETIATLHARGWSKRKLARELGLVRETVRRYIALAASKPPTVQTGSGGLTDSKSPGVQTGSQASLCVPWQKEIEEGLKSGLSVKRIYQDLVSEHQFGGSYYSLWRFVRVARCGSVAMAGVAPMMTGAGHRSLATTERYLPAPYDSRS